SLLADQDPNNANIASDESLLHVAGTSGIEACKTIADALRSTTGACHEALLTCTAAPQPWNPRLAEFAIRLYFSSKCVQLHCPTLSNEEGVQRLLELINHWLNPYNLIPDYTSSLTFVGEILLCPCDVNTNYLTSNYIEDVTHICFSNECITVANALLTSGALLYVTLNSEWTNEALRNKKTHVFKRTEKLLQHEVGHFTTEACEQTSTISLIILLSPVSNTQLQKMILFQRLEGNIIQVDMKDIKFEQTNSATSYIRLFIRGTDPNELNPTHLNQKFRGLMNFVGHTKFIALRTAGTKKNHYTLELRIEHGELSEEKKKQLNDKNSRLYKIMLRRSKVQTNAAIRACKWGHMIQDITVQLQGTSSSSNSTSQTALLVMSLDRTALYSSNLSIEYLMNCIADGFEQEQYSGIIDNIDVKGNAGKILVVYDYLSDI
ncbi:hypothetical protein P879_04918, partial [Paragonimus westermani]